MNIIDKDLIKRYGIKSFITGKDLIEEDKDVISVSPAIDIILGGGIPGGSFVNIAGKKKCGKTLLALHFAAKCQQKGRPVVYFNIEGRIKRRDMKGIKGLDADQVQFVQSNKVEETGEITILTAEDYLRIAENIIKSTPHALLIFDSVSQLASEKELASEMGEQHRPVGPVLMSQFCRKVSNLVPINDIIIISILHVVSNTSGYGNVDYITGGRKIGYAADIELMCKGFKLLRKGVKEEDEANSKVQAYGQSVTWITQSTAIAPPGYQIDSIIKYGIGIDEIAEIINLAIDTGFISVAGSWYTMSYLTGLNKEAIKIHGKDNIYTYLVEHLDECEFLNTEIRKMLIA